MTNIGGCVAKAIDGFFARLVDSALNPLLSLLSRTLLTTPDPSGLPQIGALWSSSWQWVLGMYGLVVMTAGVLLMLRETLQTRWGVKDLAPRLVVGLVGGAMSLWIATQAVRFANSLAFALAGSEVNADSAVEALRGLATTTGFVGQGLFVLLLGSTLAVTVTVLLIAYVIRVAVTMALIVAAPLALMCHALPGTEFVARWWWRAFTACLAIQVVQSLVLVTALRVFLSPGGWSFFGTKSGLVNLIVALALMAILVKTPFWLLSVLKMGDGRRSMIGTVARGFVMYKTFGLVRAAEKGVVSTLRSAQSPGPARGTGSGVGAARSHRQKPSPTAHRQSASQSSSRPTSARIGPSGPTSQGTQPGSGSGASPRRTPTPPGAGKGTRTRAAGWSTPPFTASRVPPHRAQAPTAPASAKPPPPRGSRGRQPATGLNPNRNKANRPQGGGQNPMPRGRSAPPPTAPRPTPQPPPSSSGRRLRLPNPTVRPRRKPEGGASK